MTVVREKLKAAGFVNAGPSHSTPWSVGAVLLNVNEDHFTEVWRLGGQP